MDGDSLLLLILFALFLAANAFFSCCESAYSCVSRVRIRSLADAGNVRAKRAEKILDRFDDALTTVLVGINISSIAAASVATVFVTRVLKGVPNVEAVSTLVTAGAMFLLAEMIPKTLANDRCESVSLGASGALTFFMKLFRPLVFVFEGAGRLAKKIFGKSQTPTVTEEELHEIIETVGEEGVVDEEQSDLMLSAMDFSDTSLSEIMTMREDIFSVEIGTPREDLLHILSETTHSRIPVCDGGPDRILGVLQVRWFLKNYSDHRNVPLRKLLRSAMTRPSFLPEETKIDDALEIMKRRKITLTFAVDEKKRVTGLVTVEDILEELVGEIWDEDDVVDERFYSLGGNRFEADPSLTVGEVLRRMKRTVRDSELSSEASRTVRSLMEEHLPETAEEGESFILGPYEFTVAETDGTEMTRAVIRILDPDEIPAKGGEDG
ncbi:MAG: HlyC/CorC family transporter [Clostridia bacterium]|nr:HlyC/CorC family transporter [Clostridia bacterium]